MIIDGKQVGYPHFLYTNGKSAIEALSGLDNGALAYASDTYEIGSYGNASWEWGVGGPLVDDATPQLGGDLDLNGHNIDFSSVANISDVLDEDDMSSDSDTKLATQRSIKAYADDNLGGGGGAGFPSHICQVRRTGSNQSCSAWTTISWNTEIYDTDGSWAIGDPTKIYVPSGMTKATVYAGITFNTNQGGELIVYHNGSIIMTSMRSNWSEAGKNIQTGWLTVSAGDYFMIRTYGGVVAGTSWGGPSFFQVIFSA